MIIGMVVLALISIYALWRAFRGQGVPEDVREYESRVKRSLAGSTGSIAGGSIFRTQSSNDFFAGPLKDEIGPDEDHICSIAPAELQDSSTHPHPVEAIGASGETRKPTSLGASRRRAHSSAKRGAQPPTLQPSPEGETMQHDPGNAGTSEQDR